VRSDAPSRVETCACKKAEGAKPGRQTGTHDSSAEARSEGEVRSMLSSRIRSGALSGRRRGLAALTSIPCAQRTAKRTAHSDCTSSSSRPNSARVADGKGTHGTASSITSGRERACSTIPRSARSVPPSRARRSYVASRASTFSIDPVRMRTMLRWT